MSVYYLYIFMNQFHGWYTHRKCRCNISFPFLQRHANYMNKIIYSYNIHLFHTSNIYSNHLFLQHTFIPSITYLFTKSKSKTVSTPWRREGWCNVLYTSCFQTMLMRLFNFYSSCTIKTQGLENNCSR